MTLRSFYKTCIPWRCLLLFLTFTAIGTNTPGISAQSNETDPAKLEKLIKTVKAKNTSLMKREGLANANEVMPKLLTLKFDADGIVIPVTLWKKPHAAEDDNQEANKGRMRFDDLRNHPMVHALDEVMNKIGGQKWGGRGSSMSMSGESFEVTKVFRSVSGTVKHGGTESAVMLKELSSDGRVVEWVQHHENKMTRTVLTLGRSSSDFNFVQIISDQSGIRIGYWIGEEAGWIQAADAGSLYLTHYTFVNEVLLPVMKTYGIGFANNPNYEHIQVAFLESMTGETEDYETNARKYIKELDSGVHEVRQNAMTQLNQKFSKYRKYLIEAERNGELGLEALTQVKLILERGDQKLAISGSNVPTLLKLGENVPYLVGLFDVANGGARTALVKHLQDLTGKDLGDDAEAWQKYVEDLN